MSEELVRSVRSHLLEHHVTPTHETIDAALAVHAEVLGPQARADIAGQVERELVGAGPLQPLLDDEQVTDVLVNGPDQVWIDRGSGMEHTAVGFRDEGAVRELAVRLAMLAGQRLDDASPMVDGQLLDGTRLHAALAPVVEGAAVISLRVPRRRALTLEDLVTQGAMDPSWTTVLAAIIHHRLSLLISGATGSGKTTVLAGLLALVPHDERIVLVEEARELRPTHPHVVALVARRPNVEGHGEVGLATLVRESLRMRPDRIVLGECRGAEVRELLVALNTGHEGGCATLHANSATDVPARLVALGMLAGIPAEVVVQQAACALDVVLHLAREDGRRRLAELGVVQVDGAGGRGLLRVVPALRWDGSGASVTGPGWPALAARLRLSPSGSPPGRATPWPPMPLVVAQDITSGSREAA